MSRAMSVCHGTFGRAALYELDRPLTRHAHREAHLVFYLGGGCANIRVRDRLVLASNRSAAAVNPWEAHEFLPVGHREAGIYLIFYFDPVWLKSHMPEPIDPFRIFGSAEIELSAQLRVARDQVCHYLVKGTGNGVQLEPLLAALLQTFDPGPATRRGVVNQTPYIPVWSCMDFRVRKSIAALSPDLPLTFNLGRLARDCGLSRAHFFKLFREQTGVTPVVYANTLRIENALRQITAGDASITKIGEGLGFSCQSAFTRFFAANVGMAPSDYRRAMLHA